MNLPIAVPLKRVRWSNAAALFIPALLFGYLVANQAVTQSERSTLAVRYNAPLVDTVNSLQNEQNDLKKQLNDLQSRLNDIQKTTAQTSGAAGDLSRQVEDLKVRSGLTAVTGEGIVVTLDDARLPANAKDLDKAITHNTDITDVINAGWQGGAEAISVNGERITGMSSVYCVGSTIMINDTLMSPPFQILMIGPQSRLAGLLDDPKQLTDIKNRSAVYGLVFQVSRQRDIRIPVYAGTLGSQYAVPR